jgi:L-ribulose-5-phosphate 3-epimerase
MNIAGFDIAVCSWSLRPRGAQDIISQTRKLGLNHVQLAVRPLLELDPQSRKAEIDLLRQSGLTFTAGMIDYPGEDYSTLLSARLTCGLVPDDRWEERLDATLRAARLLAEMEIDRLTCHIGFIPRSSDPQYQTIAQRVREVASKLEEIGIAFGMETGQETASELLQFINDVRSRNVFVNFDPANMVLYGSGDPIEAIRTLGRHIAHVHAKDARWSDRPGQTWGTEVPFGAGNVNVERFLKALWDVHYDGPIAIERESGDQRFDDVQTAIDSLKVAGGA